MQPEFFTEGKNLMVSIKVDACNTVTRLATKAEQASWTAAQKPVEAPKPKSKK